MTLAIGPAVHRGDIDCDLHHALATVDADGGSAPSADEPVLAPGGSMLARPSDGAIDWSWAGRASHPAAPGEAGPAAAPCAGTADARSPEDRVQDAFKQAFAAKAANREEFDAFMKSVFGDKIDGKLAEQYRQQALAGDFSFLPKVQFVDGATLGGGMGAYNEQDGVVYINREVAAADPAKAAQIFIEEAGAHLDARLNVGDTQGDEGEMFRRVLGGEQLSAREAAAIRSENDHGTITVDGKTVNVEFWFGEDIVDAVGSAAKDVGKAIGSAAEDVGKAVGSAAAGVGGAIGDAASWAGKGIGMVGGGVIDGLGSVGRGALGAFKDFGKGVFIDIMGGFFSNLYHGNIGEAFSSVVRGVDRAVFQSTQNLFSGVLDGFQSAANGVTRALGPLGEPLRWVTDRAFDIGQTLLDTGFGIGRDAFRIIPDTFTGFVTDIERAVDLAADGRWGDALEQLGMSFVNLPGRVAGPMVDMAARALRGGASVGLTAVGAEPPARKLNAEEVAYLKQIYGDSIDYDAIRVKPGGPLNDTARTVGNTVYMEDEHFNADGTLTPEGLTTLGHEVGHVWQNQNGGGDYIHNALGAQALAAVTGGDRDAAYDWRAARRDGASFESMNDEQRAKLMEDIGLALFGKPFGTMTPAEQDRVIADVRRALNGGAPFDSLTAAERTQLDSGIRMALNGREAFGTMNAAERAQVMGQIRTTLSGIASFQARSPQQQQAILDEISRSLADGRIDANDGARLPTDLKPMGEGNYTPEEVAFMIETWQKLKSGQGAG